MAHHSVFNLSEVTVWGRSLDKACGVVASLAEKGIAAHATADLQHALANADIVAAATTASTPFIPSAWVMAGTHLGLIGAFTANMAEAELQLLPRAQLFADNRAAVLEKGGEVVQALRAGLIAAQDVLAELSELVASPALVNFRRAESDITVFKSVGFAALDLIAAEHVLSGLAG